jgi:hypothetical protein
MWSWSNKKGRKSRNRPALAAIMTGTHVPHLRLLQSGARRRHNPVSDDFAP